MCYRLDRDKVETKISTFIFTFLACTAIVRATENIPAEDLQKMCKVDPEKPFPCYPTGECCTGFQFCNLNAGDCVSCFPEYLKTEEEIFNWCRSEGQYEKGQKEMVDILRCKSACYNKFRHNLTAPEADKEEEPIPIVNPIQIRSTDSSVKSTKNEDDKSIIVIPFIICAITIVVCVIIYLSRKRIKSCFLYIRNRNVRSRASTNTSTPGNLWGLNDKEKGKRPLLKDPDEVVVISHSTSTIASCLNDATKSGVTCEQIQGKTSAMTSDTRNTQTGTNTSSMNEGLTGQPHLNINDNADNSGINEEEQEEHAETGMFNEEQNIVNENTLGKSSCCFDPNHRTNDNRTTQPQIINNVSVNVINASEKNNSRNGSTEIREPEQNQNAEQSNNTGTVSSGVNNTREVSGNTNDTTVKSRVGGASSFSQQQEETSFDGKLTRPDLSRLPDSTPKKNGSIATSKSSQNQDQINTVDHHYE